MSNRAATSERALGADEGLTVACAASMDNLLTFPKSMLVRRAPSPVPAARSCAPPSSPWPPAEDVEPYRCSTLSPVSRRPVSNTALASEIMS